MDIAAFTDILPVGTGRSMVLFITESGTLSMIWLKTFEAPTNPPIASMESTPSASMPQDLSQPLPSVTPLPPEAMAAPEVPPVSESTDVVNTLGESSKEKKGGGAVVIVLIVIIVALLATIGYFAFKIFF